MLDFFCDYMNYDILGKIATSHLIHADRDEKKHASNEKCLQLSEYHGHAVDFPKTGYCPPIPGELIAIKEYPDFMEKEEEDTYESPSILGHLYRDIKRRIEASVVNNEGNNEITTQPLDEDLISIKPALNFTESEVEDTLKTLYLFVEDIERIKFLANLENEFEIYTGNVTSKTKGKPKKNKGFKHGKLMEQIIILKRKYQHKFFGNNATSLRDYNQKLRHELGEVFSEDLRAKAALWYSVSYL